MSDLVVSSKFLEYGLWSMGSSAHLVLFFAQCGSCEGEIGWCAGAVAARTLDVGLTGHGGAGEPVGGAWGGPSIRCHVRFLIE